jgi:VCBS repeat protein
MIRRALLYILIPAYFVLTGAQASRQAAPQTRSPAPTSIVGLDGRPDTLPDAAFVDTVRKECSQCHYPPLPEYMPRGQWRTRVQEMALHSMAGTGLAPGQTTSLWQLDLAPFIRYFEARSPVELPLPPPWPEGDGGLRFERQPWSPDGPAKAPVTANVRFFDLDGDGRPELVSCDMRQGLVLLGEPAKAMGALRPIARVPNPAHSERVDLDTDGRQDLLVADLGDFLPEDHRKGSIVWLRQTGPLQFEATTLVSGLPRTADVQAADFDGDGDLDLVAAEFGWRTVGGVLVYENKTTDWKQPRFEGRVVDPRPGAIHVPIVDLDHDGKPDFVAMISQQYEHVVAYLNRGGQGFQQETIFRAIVPMWGSSGIQLIDLDKDGDLDLLMTNGDSLDDFTIRPFHGVRWFENEGRFPWKQHELVLMPGVHRAQAADMDGDGDLDVVAAAFLPNVERPQSQLRDSLGKQAPLTSLGWLEQTKPGVFAPHVLEQGSLAHATLDLADVDGDGDVDLVTGNFVGPTFASRETSAAPEAPLVLWINRLRP